MSILDVLRRFFVGAEEKTIGEEIMPYVTSGQMHYFNAQALNPYSNSYVVYRAINLIASNSAEVNLKLYRDSNQLDRDNEVSRLLRMPNPDMSGYELFEYSYIYFYLYGEAFWFLNTNEAGVVKEIYTLNPKYMEHTVDKNTGRISKWVYNKAVPMEPEQVVHFKLFNINSTLRGMSPLSVAKLEYEADNAAAQFNKSFFDNFAQLGGVITVDKESEISIEQMRAVVEKFNQQHKGASKAYKVAGLLGGMQFKEITASMQDLRFIEGRDAIRDRILLLLGVPRAVLGISDGVDRAVAQTQMRALWTLTIKPNLIRFQEKLNAKLLDIYYPGLNCVFDFDSIEELKPDLNETLEAANKLFQLGYNKGEINERLSLGMPATDDDETRYISISMIETGTVEAPTPAKEIEAVVDKSARENRIQAQYLRAQAAQERVFQAALKKYMFSQRKKVLGALNGNKATTEEAEIIAAIATVIDGDTAELEKVMKPLYAEAVKSAVKLSLAAIDLDSPYEVPKEIIMDRVNFIKNLNKTTFKKLREIIETGIREGQALQQIEKNIKKFYNFADSRIKTIARTESCNMMSNSTMQTYKDNNVKKSAWLSARDGRVRPEHVMNDQQGAIPVGMPFSNGERYPAERSINCRCTLIPVVE